MKMCRHCGAPVPTDKWWLLNVRLCHPCNKAYQRSIYKPRPRRQPYHKPTYKAWWAMVQRCTDPNFECWPDYGARGITVCARWRDSFLAFAEDMGNCPAGLTIDRLDNNGNYEPGNCRWATRQQQAANRRSSMRIEINGVTKCAREWARDYGINHNTVMSRIYRGWDCVKALTVPPCHS